MRVYDRQGKKSKLIVNIVVTTINLSDQPIVDLEKIKNQLF